VKFSPKSEKEIAEANLVTPGTYDFEVVSASDDLSKSGNEMIKLKLRIFTDDGERTVFDYLLEAIPHKFRHFFDAIGMIDKYDSGEVSAIDCAGVAGKVKIGIQKDKSGTYADRNTVLDYIVGEPSVASTREALSFEDDDIRF
jgi:hypothetical protein